MRSPFVPVAALVSLSISCAAAAPRVEPPPPPVCPSASSVAAAPSATASASPTTPLPTASAAPPAPVVATPPPSPPAFERALDAAQEALASGDAAATDARLAEAEAAGGDDTHLRYLVARVRATRFALAGDFERAAAALVSIIPALARHPELPDEFWSHNAMMMIREAQGDPAAALAEDDQATLCATRGSWDPAERETLAFQKDRWHRAYLTRMLAESRAGSVKEALIQYARAALDEYRTRGFPDSIAVLEAYFAALDGKREEARAAARRVDPAKDDDVEDLYLVVVGLEAGGDHAAADTVRRLMRTSNRPSLSHAIMLRWVDLDAKAGATGAFTPWHAHGRAR